MSEAELLALLKPVTHGGTMYRSTSELVVDRRIGKGQFSVVFRARSKTDGSVVALKKVQIFDMMDAKARVDCVKETNLLQVIIWLLFYLWHLPLCEIVYFGLMSVFMYCSNWIIPMSFDTFHLSLKMGS